MDTRLGHVFPYGQIHTKDTKENVWSRNLKIEQLYIAYIYLIPPKMSHNKYRHGKINVGTFYIFMEWAYPYKL